MVEILVRLPDALAQQAEAIGILNDARLAALIEREIDRERAWERLSEMAGIVCEAASSEYGMLSDDEVMDLVNEEIHVMRAEEQYKIASGDRTAP